MKPTKALKTCLSGLLIMLAVLAQAETIRDFSSDGCSRFPDGTLEDSRLWCDCCVAHDKAYWQGGTAWQKQAADEALRECVLQKTGSLMLAETMYYGVFFGGAAWLPTDYRWGYGWEYGRGYEPLTVSELQQVEMSLQTYKEKLQGPECPVSVFEFPLSFRMPW